MRHCYPKISHLETMANDRDVVDACTTTPITTIANSKLINDNHGDGNYITSREKVEYTLKPPTRAYVSTAR